MDETIIRTAMAGDAARFVALWHTLQTEAEGLLFEAGASQSALGGDNSSHHETAKSGFAHILFLDDIHNTDLVGFAAATRLPTDSSIAEIIIAIRQTHTGRGWGLKLLQGIQAWASASGISQLNLAVAAGNSAALKLYQKFGFEILRTDPVAVQTMTGRDDLHVMIKPLV